MTTQLFLISAGAAKGLVEGIREAWTRASGTAIAGTFGAVGAMREALLGGAPCDVLILTQAMLEDLGRDGAIDPGTIRALGRVYTGVAVPAGAPMPDIAEPAALAHALKRATAIYFPDPERATAGIHFAKVLRTLGVYDELQSRLRPFPNGATAMRAMADAGDLEAIGCTQVTEILYTPGVALVGRLPRAFELSTVYSAAVTARASDARLARRFVDRLTGREAAELRARGGFEGPA